MSVPRRIALFAFLPLLTSGEARADMGVPWAPPVSTQYRFETPGEGYVFFLRYSFHGGSDEVVRITPDGVFEPTKDRKRMHHIVVVAVPRRLAESPDFKADAVTLSDKTPGVLVSPPLKGLYRTKSILDSSERYVLPYRVSVGEDVLIVTELPEEPVPALVLGPVRLPLYSTLVTAALLLVVIVLVWLWLRRRGRARARPATP